MLVYNFLKKPKKMPSKTATTAKKVNRKVAPAKKSIVKKVAAKKAAPAKKAAATHHKKATTPRKPIGEREDGKRTFTVVEFGGKKVEPKARLNNRTPDQAATKGFNRLTRSVKSLTYSNTIKVQELFLLLCWNKGKEGKVFGYRVARTPLPEPKEGRGGVIIHFKTKAVAL